MYPFMWPNCQLQQARQDSLLPPFFAPIYKVNAKIRIGVHDIIILMFLYHNGNGYQRAWPAVASDHLIRKCIPRCAHMLLSYRTLALMLTILLTNCGGIAGRRATVRITTLGTTWSLNQETALVDQWKTSFSLPRTCLQSFTVAGLFSPRKNILVVLGFL